MWDSLTSYQLWYLHMFYLQLTQNVPTDYYINFVFFMPDCFSIFLQICLRWDQKFEKNQWFLIKVNFFLNFCIVENSPTSLGQTDKKQNWRLYWIFLPIDRRVASSNTSRLVPNPGFYRLPMKVIFRRPPAPALSYKSLDS